MLGTRSALKEKGRESITLTVPDVSAKTLGALIAIFERTVGFYGSLVNVNAYHQPGVEAGKKAATTVLALQLKLLDVLGPKPQAVGDLAKAAGGDPETAFKILQHLAFNGRIKREGFSFSKNT